MISTDIAKQLLQINAIKLNLKDPFTWASGMRSPIYCDNRLALSNPQVRKNILSGFLSFAKQEVEITLIAGVATAGVPWGAILAHELGLPYAYIRGKPKGHGRENLIEGTIRPTDKVLVIEDLISTGGSSIKAVNAIRNVEAEVIKVLAIFEYGFPRAKENFKNANCSFTTLSNYTDLLEAAKEMDYISNEEQIILASWKNDPDDWAKKLQA